MRFIYAFLAAAMLSATARADDYVVIVFDTSGSMGEYMRSAGKTRMAIAQDALIEVLSKVPATTKVGILTFDGWAYDLGPVDQGRLDQAIRNCRPGGGTPLYEFMKQGGTRLLEERQKQNNLGSYKLLVVTDGQAQDDQLNNDGTWRDGAFRPGVVNDIISRGIIVDAIGLDMREDHLLKSKINGFYMRGDDPNSLKQGLSKAVAEVGFNGNDALSNEIFNEVADLPEPFAKAAIKGLTEFQNQPIGERAPIKVVRDGVMVEEPHPDGVPADGGGMGWGWWLLIIFGAVLVVMIVVTVSSNRR